MGLNSFAPNSKCTSKACWHWHFDLIVLNSLNDKGAGFGHDTNKITIIDNENNIQHFELKSKKEVAKDIIDAITQKLQD